MQHAGDLLAIREELERLSARIRLFAAQREPSSAVDIAKDRLGTAKSWKQANMLLGGIFGEDLCGIPVWNILLELYIQHVETGLPQRTKSVCIASAAPHTSALRYIATLAARGWLEQVPDDSDGRVTGVRITPTAVDLVEKALDRVTRNNEQLGIGHLRLVQ